MKIYAISGLGADKRVFSYLYLDCEVITIDWISPNPKESIVAYTKRLIYEYGIENEETFAIMGVSFGGLIAIEMSKIVTPSFTVLISSIETYKELPPYFRVVGNLGLIKLLPTKLLIPSKGIAQYFFGARNKKLLNAILSDTDPICVKWAIRELLNWENEQHLPNVIKISGTKDKLFPPKEIDYHSVHNGEHFMIVDRASEVSEIMNKTIQQFWYKED